MYSEVERQSMKEYIDYLRYQSQSKQEWSEEDETALGDLMWCIEQARKSAKDENDMGNIWFAENWVKNRLKSLRPQPQRRDTYYDIIHNILDMLKGMDFIKITPEHRVSLLNDIRVKCKNADECAAILDEPSWKPSEEQIYSLGTVVKGYNECTVGSVGYHLKEMYEQLNKLKRGVAPMKDNDE